MQCVAAGRDCVPIDCLRAAGRGVQ
jgi:hypothetical protein